MPKVFAQLLYKETALGMTVVITDLDEVPRIAPTPDILQGEEISESIEGGTSMWQPEKSPSGPISIVISGADSRLVVLRNGMIIGSASVQIQGEISSTTAYSLSNIDTKGFHWVELPLPGQSWLGNRELSATERGRVAIPPTFRADLDEVLVPGATLVVTNDSLRAAATGQKLRILETEPN